MGLVTMIWIAVTLDALVIAVIVADGKRREIL